MCGGGGGGGVKMRGRGKQGGRRVVQEAVEERERTGREEHNELCMPGNTYSVVLQ